MSNDNKGGSNTPKPGQQGFQLSKIGKIAPTPAPVVKNDLTNKPKGIIKEEIDAMTYFQMLRKWRFTPAGDPLFTKDNPEGEYFIKRMKELKEADPAGAVQASKDLSF